MKMEKKDLGTILNLPELRTIAEAALEESANAEDTATANEARAYSEDAVSRYNEVAKAETFAYCRNSSNPLVTAVTAFFFEGIKIKDTKNKETKTVTSEIVTTKRPIDLVALNKFCKPNGIGIDPTWINVAQYELYPIMMSRAAFDAGDVTLSNLLRKKDFYKIRGIAADIAAGKTPISNTNIKKVLQDIVTKALGPNHPIKAIDTGLLMELFIRDDRSPIGVEAIGVNALIGVLKKIFFRILTGAPNYEVHSRSIDADAIAAAIKPEEVRPKSEPEASPEIDAETEEDAEEDA